MQRAHSRAVAGVGVGAALQQPCDGRHVGAAAVMARLGNGSGTWVFSSPPFSSPFSQFWLGPLNVLLLKDQTYFCFEVCLALNKYRCVRGMAKMTPDDSPFHEFRLQLMQMKEQMQTIQAMQQWL